MNWPRHFMALGAALAPGILFSSDVLAIHYLGAEELQRQAFPEAERFTALELSLSSEERGEIEKRADAALGEGALRIWAAEAGSERLGYVVVDDVLGKHDFITFGFRISPQGKLDDLEILDYRETKGGQVSEKSWRAQFSGRGLSDGLQLQQGSIQNISGATLSCKHITDRLRAWLALYEVKLK